MRSIGSVRRGLGGVCIGSDKMGQRGVFISSVTRTVIVLSIDSVKTGKEGVFIGTLQGR
jgi:hypothetical protein